MSTTNLEEAATVASEFVSSLDNLPTEVQFLLLEMKHKEERSQELHAEIQKESSKYIRHSLRSTPSQSLSAKDGAVPATVQAHYLEIDRLAREKEDLAERIVQLVARARAKLDCELSRVLMLQGEPELAAQPGFYLGTITTSRNPVTQLNESLRSAIAVPEAPSASVVTSHAPPPQKRRRVTATTTSAGSIKLPSPAPVSVAPPVHTSGGGLAAQRSRLSQQVHLRNSPAARGRRGTASVGPEADEDAEGEDDVEEDVGEESGDAEDKSLYCVCQKMSYGEMIGCDNPDCRMQWFHLPCVNLKPPLPDRWFCSECQALLGSALNGGPERRKGRKK
ncbi:hypothetical protein PHLCEN_2v10714 [Hermanssonia centrifuga]|uniref:Chromatin modification-related protein n=1 Tax=Hermanssonia centrifuga TaxID=98765 RepID=A0A2R6NM22_9APHY|nr:hypothetical protein PHLCEN_2v10714 [Hermanssonia centrifuga]